MPNCFVSTENAALPDADLEPTPDGSGVNGDPDIESITISGPMAIEILEQVSEPVVPGLIRRPKMFSVFPSSGHAARSGAGGSAMWT
jgi:hypothetical protein